MKPERKRPLATFEEVCDFVEMIGTCYSVVINTKMIYKDLEAAMKHLKKIDKECKDYEKESKRACPYVFYIGIRTRGVEGSESIEAISRKMENPNDITVFTFKIEYNGQYIVSYRQAEVIFK